MDRHAKIICSYGPDQTEHGGGDVLNVGFGLGLVDEAIQVCVYMCVCVCVVFVDRTTQIWHARARAGGVGRRGEA